MITRPERLIPYWEVQQAIRDYQDEKKVSKEMLNALRYIGYLDGKRGAEYLTSRASRRADEKPLFDVHVGEYNNAESHRIELKEVGMIAAIKYAILKVDTLRLDPQDKRFVSIHGVDFHVALRRGDTLRFHFSVIGRSDMVLVELAYEFVNELDPRYGTHSAEGEQS